MTIPAGTRGEFQPEYVFFFRQRKYMWNSAVSHVRLFHSVDITEHHTGRAPLP